MCVCSYLEQKPLVITLEGGYVWEAEVSELRGIIIPQWASQRVTAFQLGVPNYALAVAAALALIISRTVLETFSHLLLKV